MRHLLVIGYGYSARRIGEDLVARGWRVSGTRRGREAARDVAPVDVRPIVFDGERASREVRTALATATHLLISAPPGEAGDPTLTHHRDDVVAAPRLEWIGYLSTTGVYGDRNGEWVDESTPPDPGTLRGRRRLEAERAWEAAAAERGVPLQIFRLAGIYGPGRSAVDRLRRGTARNVVAPDAVFNRVHVDDVAGAVLAGLEHGGGAEEGATGVFNVADDLPAPPHDVLVYAAELLGVEPPPEVPLEETDLSEAARSFYDESKRVRNRRLASELGYRLRYPTYREGLTAIVEKP